MFEKDFKVYGFLCHKGKLMINNLINLFLVSSDEEFISRGNNYEDVIYSKGLTWMIYKWKIGFNREILEDENIRIRTWPSGFDKLYSYREYEVYGQDDTLLAKASAVFLLIEIERKKPIRLPKDIIALYENYEKRNFPNIERLENNSELIKLDTYRVRKSDIDYNNHVNNSVYFRWIFNCIPENFLKNKFISEINLIYNREIKAGGYVDIFTNRDYSFFEIKTDNTHSRAAIKFKSFNK